MSKNSTELICYTNTICGYIDRLLIDLQECVSPEILIGMPIHSEDGIEIGKITRIDGEFWYADVNKEFRRSVSLSVEIGGK